MSQHQHDIETTGLAHYKALIAGIVDECIDHVRECFTEEMKGKFFLAAPAADFEALIVEKLKSITAAGDGA